MPIGTTAALIGGSLLSAGTGLLGSKNAADAQKDAATQASTVQLRMFNQNREDMEPWRLGGQQALQAYLYELGIGPRPARYSPGPLTITGPDGTRATPDQRMTSATPSVGGLQNFTREGPEYAGPQTTPGVTLDAFRDASGTYTVGDRTFPTLDAAKRYATTERDARDASFNHRGFQHTPGYEFLSDEGMKQINRSLASRGLFFSGPAAKETARFHTGLLNQEYGTYMNRLAAAAGMGQTQSQSLASLGQNFANNQSQLLQNAGNARASGYLGMANAVNQGIGNLSQTFLLSQMGAFNPPAVVS